jgi:hypothetical protein
MGNNLFEMKPIRDSSIVYRNISLVSEREAKRKCLVQRSPACCVCVCVCGDLETSEETAWTRFGLQRHKNKTPKIYAKIKENNFNGKYVECCLFQVALLTILCHHKLRPTISKLCAEYYHD